MKSIAKAWNSISLVKQIIIGLVIGIILAMIAPDKLAPIAICGDLFVKALKAVAPVLVLFLVMSAICQHKKGQKTNMKTVIVLYLVGTLMAGTIAVIASFLFKPEMVLATADTGDVTPPDGISEVLNTLLGNLVSNPVDAIMNANFLGILAWAVVLGFALKHASETTKGFIQDLADGLSTMVRWVIKFAPLGIMGLVFNSVATTGFDGLKSYGTIILLLVGVMVFDALVINPIIVFVTCKRNPYPLILRCLKDSGITAFFTRSSAANIPVNMGLCDSLGLNKDTYGISIPLGATINMGGAAITISVLSLAAAHSLGIAINPLSAIILCVLSAASACGASGVAGGSLLLIPLACSLFGIPVDIAMEVVGVGFIIGVVQDSCETALNSSTDVVFTAAAEYRELRKQGK